MEFSACSHALPHLSGVPSHPGVLGYRGFRLAAAEACRRLEPPADAVILFLVTEGELLISEPPHHQAPFVVRRASVCGLCTHGLRFEHRTAVTGVEVALAPWAAFRLLGTPLRHLSRRVVELDTLLPAGRCAALLRALGASGDWRERFRMLDAELGALLARGPVPAVPVARAWRSLTQAAAAPSVAELAREVGLSQSQLARRFVEQVGVTPKAAARIVRLRRTLGLMAGGCSAADAALQTGYCDQAHFSREFKAMTGVPPRRFPLGG
ncbi:MULTISPECIES: helix-turn-helix domain-containing protein, partial [Streptomyces]|uniref:Helix-turn-helix domain-containing protein n=1 Tax=Streptomyces eurythermus TaxID=42237 RepID=A0ABW6YQX1_9ACTN